jgi:hypothetical protein
VGTVILVALMLVVFRAWAMPAAPHGGPGVISYQGTLTEPGGQPVDGDLDMTFGLFDVSTGGTALWTEAHNGANSVPVSEGLFNVLLGSLSPIPSTVWDSASLFLEVTVGGEMLAPREAVGSVPHALYAVHAELAYNLSAADGDPVHAATVDDDGAVHVEGGGEASLAGGGRLVLGPASDNNIALDGDEIMARNSGAATTLYLQPDGGDLDVGGSLTLNGGLGIQRTYKIFWYGHGEGYPVPPPRALGEWDLCALASYEIAGPDEWSSDWGQCLVYPEFSGGAWGDHPAPGNHVLGPGVREEWFIKAVVNNDTDSVKCQAICVNFGE